MQTLDVIASKKKRMVMEDARLRSVDVSLKDAAMGEPGGGSTILTYIFHHCRLSIADERVKSGRFRTQDLWQCIGETRRE